MDLIGWTLENRYRVDRELASSFLSTLFAGRDTEKDREVRIRTPHPDLLAVPGYPEAAARELRARAGRHSPHLLPLLESGFDGELPFGVLAAPEGGSLSERLGDGPGNLDLVASWLPSVAAALDRMHDRGTVHREVSVETIFFGPAGEPWLLDDSFAVALAEKAPDRAPPVRTPGELGDLPPEILERKIGPAYDQYGLAAAVFRCLAGRPLQPSDSYLGVGQAVAERLPAPAVDLLERALSVVPDDRFTSCGAFAAAFLDAAGVETDGMDETGTLMMDVRDIVGRTKREETGEIPVAAPLAPEDEATGAVAADPVPEARPRAAAPPPPRGPAPAPASSRRGPKAALIVVLILVLAGAGAAAFLVLGPGDKGEDPATPGATAATPPTPAEPTPAEPAPAELTPGEPTPAEPTPGEPTPGEPTPGEPTPGEPTPAEPTPAEPAPLPVLRIISPADGALLPAGPVTVRGRIEGGPAAAVVVGTTRVAPGADGTFETTLRLTAGENRIVATPYAADDREGMAATVRVVYDPDPPVLEVETPPATREASVTIRGRAADEHPGPVLVDGRPAETDAGGGFSATVPIPAGTSTVRVVAEDRAGNRREAEVRVERDSTPPRVRVLSPASGSTTGADRVTVRVAAEDGSPVEVAVAGRAAHRLPDGTFEATVPLETGENEIEVVATDRPGNRAVAPALRVTREDRSVTLRLDAAPADWVAGASVVVEGTVSRAGANVTVGGVPATVTGTRFRGEAPLEPGAEGVVVRARLPDGPPASAVFPVRRPAPGVAMAGPATFRTAAGELLEIGEGGKLVLRAPDAEAEGAQLLALLAGGLSGTIGDSTRIDLPAGRIGVRSGETATFDVRAPGDERATLALTAGRVLVTRGDLGVLVLEGQTVDLEAYDRHASRLRFRVGAETRGAVVVLRRASPSVEFYLVVPPGTGGVIEPGADADRTRVTSAPDSAAPMELRRIVDGALESSTQVSPGQSTQA